MLSYTLVAAALPVLALAAPQYGYADSSSSSSAVVALPSMNSTMNTNTTSTASAATASATSVGNSTTHVVLVGGGPLTYTPNFVNAAIGDQVVFEFHKANHTLTQTSFASPCSPLQVNGTFSGIDSGFVPVGANSTVFPTFTVTVTETTPLWFACKQGAHCKMGMGFAINPPTTGNTIESFIAKAMNSTEGFNSTATPSNNGTGVSASASVSQLPAASGTSSAAAKSSSTSTTSGATKVTIGSALAVIAFAVGIIV